MRISLTQIGYNTIDELVNSVCITRTFAYMCWLLHDFSDECEGKSLDDGSPLFCACELTVFLLHDSV
jgi:hypothetical protein